MASLTGLRKTLFAEFLCVVWVVMTVGLVVVTVFDFVVMSLVIKAGLVPLFSSFRTEAVASLWKSTTKTCSSTVFMLVEAGESHFASKTGSCGLFTWYKALLVQFMSAFCQKPMTEWCMSTAFMTTELIVLFTGTDTV